MDRIRTSLISIFIGMVPAGAGSHGTSGDIPAGGNDMGKPSPVVSHYSVTYEIRGTYSSDPKIPHAVIQMMVGGCDNHGDTYELTSPVGVIDSNVVSKKAEEGLLGLFVQPQCEVGSDYRNTTAHHLPRHHFSLSGLRPDGRYFLIVYSEQLACSVSLYELPPSESRATPAIPILETPAGHMGHCDI